MPDFGLDKAFLKLLALITGNFVGDTDTQTLTNKTIDSTANTISNLRSNAVYTIFIDGTTVKARNNITGVIDYTADNTVNAVTAINSAINNIQNITGASLDTEWAGRIFITSGKYKCVTTIAMTPASTGRAGIILEGEGKATRLDFTPAGAVTDAILLQLDSTQLVNLRISANANITNLVHIKGVDASTRFPDNGLIYRCQLEGPNSGESPWAAIGAPIAGQVGILEDGFSGTVGNFWWKITDNQFISLDTAIKASPSTNSTSLHITNDVFNCCTTAVYLDGAGHIVDDLWIQGTATYGVTGVQCTTNGDTNIITNIYSELHKTATTCATVKLDSGAANNMISNIRNGLQDNTNFWSVLDNSAVTTNQISYYDIVTGFQISKPKINFKGSTIRSNDSGYELIDASGGTIGGFSLSPVDSGDQLFLGFMPGSGFTSGGSAADMRSELRFYNTTNGTANREYLEFAAQGTVGFYIGPFKEAAGSLRPFKLQMGGNDIITLNTDSSMNFNSRPISNATIDATLNPIAKTGASFTYTIFLDGTLVKALNNVTGVVDYSGTAATDCIPTIQSAINNIQNVGSGIDATYGGGVFIKKGAYTCKTNLNVATTVTGKGAVHIVGEGQGTHLDFSPGSALTSAITLKGSYTILENMTISANTNVTNFIIIQGSSTTPANSWPGARGKINNVAFEGPNWGGTYLPAAVGQIAIKIDGTSGTLFPFLWRITNCDFGSIDTGILCTGSMSTSTFQSNNSFVYCDVGVDLDSLEHNVFNMWCQGNTTAGTTGVRLRASAQGCNIVNLITEFSHATLQSQAVLADSGAGKNILENITNVNADNVTKFVIKDNSGTGTNKASYYDTFLNRQATTNTWFTDPTTSTLNLVYPANTVANGPGIILWAKDSANALALYAGLYGMIVSNTAGAQRGTFQFWMMDGAGAFLERMRVDGDGNIYMGSGLFINLNTTGLTTIRQFTFPDAAAKLVGEATTQTLTNKTIDARGTGNVLSNHAVNPRVKRWGCFQPSSASGTTAANISSLDGILTNHTPTGAGTNTLTFDTTEGVIANFVGTATANLNLGLVSGTTGPICRRLFGLKMSCRVKIDSTTSARMFVGFAAAALAISDTPIASGVDGVLVGFISTATNFEIYSNDATAGFTTTAITGPIAKNANWHTIEINWTASGNVDVIFDGTTQTLSAQIPLTTTNLFFNCVGQTTTTTARTFSIHDIWIEADK